MNLFNERKLTDAALYFILHSKDRVIQKLQLMKLLYLAERASLEQYHSPLIGDTLESRKHGPVLSTVLDYFHGDFPKGSRWNEYIKSLGDYGLGIQDKYATISEEDLAELSDADLELLADVWRKYGHHHKWRLANITHKKCAEWKAPPDRNGSVLITYQDVFNALGFSKELQQDILRDLEEYSRFNTLMQQNDKYLAE